jgi:hypothetical protein
MLIKRQNKPACPAHRACREQKAQESLQGNILRTERSEGETRRKQSRPLKKASG